MITEHIVADKYIKIYKILDNHKENDDMKETKYIVTNNFKSVTVNDRTAAVTKLMEIIINKSIENESIKV